MGERDGNEDGSVRKQEETVKKTEEKEKRDKLENRRASEYTCETLERDREEKRKKRTGERM
jgi:hypothetical protein